MEEEGGAGGGGVRGAEGVGVFEIPSPDGHIDKSIADVLDHRWLSSLVEWKSGQRLPGEEVLQLSQCAALNNRPYVTG